MYTNRVPLRKATFDMDKDNTFFSRIPLPPPSPPSMEQSHYNLFHVYIVFPPPSPQKLHVLFEENV